MDAFDRLMLALIIVSCCAITNIKADSRHIKVIEAVSCNVEAK